MALVRWVQRFEQRLQGWPDDMLSAALVAAAFVLFGLAFFAPATVKGSVLAWVILP